jgi:hypothetical protein
MIVQTNTYKQKFIFISISFELNLDYIEPNEFLNMKSNLNQYLKLLPVRYES